MGNKGTKLNTDKVTEITNDCMTTFSKEFSSAYKDNIVQKIKHDHIGDGGTENTYKLSQALTADQFIKTGYLIKLGGQVHNWKRRFFIAMNKADNFAIVYSENESTSTVKGRFYCCGYTIVPFTKEELATYGIYGMKLTPPDPTKRQWVIRAKTLDEYKQWFEVFSNACRKTRPLSASDIMKDHAFKTAYRNLRVSYGYFGMPNIYGIETDQLEVFVYRLLRRELIDSYLVSISQSPSSSSGKKKNDEMNPEELAAHTTMTTIKPIISTSWRESSQSVDAMSSSFESSVIPLYDAYMDAEQQLYDQVQDRIKALTQPVINDAVMMLVKPIISKILSKLITAYERSYENVMNALQPCIDSVSERPDILSSNITTIDAELESIDSGPLAQTQAILRQLTIDDLSSFTSFLEKGNLPAFDIYLDMLEIIRNLARNAIFTFHNIATAAMVFSPDSPAVERRPSLLKSPSSSRSASFRYDNDNNSPSSTSPLARHPSMASSRSPSNINPLSKKRQTAILLPAALRPKLIETINDVITSYNNDIQVSIISTLKQLILDLMEPNIQERILIPCHELSSQLLNKIPKNLVNFISIHAIIERHVRKVVDKAILEVIQNYEPEITIRLDMMSAKLVIE